MHTKLSMCRVTPHDMPYLEEGEDQRSRDQAAFYTMQRINPLGSTVSITSMLYCIYSLILLLWV
ncbi:unnamed protein product [Staurois parvus]|uniref:Uncharacterized protein n=1 Tax=Staurois parvus TaxID=386267 RepID=A0ABN9B8U5_9NEOB|nr:unnamed protein product [Staurois parvus]